MLGLNEIYCGESENLLKYLDDESIDLVVTSPPYDNLRKYSELHQPKGWCFSKG